MNLKIAILTSEQKQEKKIRIDKLKIEIKNLKGKNENINSILNTISETVIYSQKETVLHLINKFIKRHRSPESISVLNTAAELIKLSA